MKCKNEIHFKGGCTFRCDLKDNHVGLHEVIGEIEDHRFQLRWEA